LIYRFDGISIVQWSSENDRAEKVLYRELFVMDKDLNWEIHFYIGASRSDIAPILRCEN
jgi:hypothetical protein